MDEHKKYTSMQNIKIQKAEETFNAKPYEKEMLGILQSVKKKEMNVVLILNFFF